MPLGIGCEDKSLPPSPQHLTALLKSRQGPQGSNEKQPAEGESTSSKAHLGRRGLWDKGRRGTRTIPEGKEL